MHGLRHIIAVFVFIVILSNAWGLASDPPSGLDGTLATIAEEGYLTTYTSRGWGATYGFPQSQYSIDETDFHDNSVDFGEIGLYGLGLENLLNPQYSELNVGTDSPAKIEETAQSLILWVWTPATEDFGIHHQGVMPNNGITNVKEKIMGINTASNACIQDASVAYNQWGVPKDTINKQTTSTLSSLAGEGYLFLLAAKQKGENEQKYMKIAKGIGDMFLTTIITPATTSFGLHPENLVDQYNNTIPLGMMPSQFTILSNSEDTSLCSDGGSIKLHENRKIWMAQAAHFLSSLGTTTGETKYTEASQIITDGILSIQECDGSFKDYTRWEGAGTVPNNCTPTDGSDSYEAYPGNVTVAETKGFITDTGMILYLLQRAKSGIYTSSLAYRNAVTYLLELEENDAGFGYKKNGGPIKYASYSIDTENRAFAQLLESNVFLRASCEETNTDVQKRLQDKAYELIQKSDIFIPSELDSKIANAISPDPGINILAVSMAADNWKIITKGCQECGDADEDGYIDGECAGDTVKYDCNDTDTTIHPGAEETCDRIDNDCDGITDNGFDEDQDGHSTCAEPSDCNDAHDEIYPGAPEKDDEMDNDCNGKIDDAGIEMSILTDLNTGIEGAEVLLVDYGNACAGSFANPAENIEEIKSQCSTIGNCITDENGSCFVNVKKDGKFQALVQFSGANASSNPYEYAAGQHILIRIAFDTNNISANDNQEVGKGNPFTDNPYMVWGMMLILLILLGIGFVYFYRTGKIPPITEWGKGFRKTVKEDKKGTTIRSLPIGGKIKIPSLSANRIASKIVSGKIEKPKQPKVGNFPPKKTDYGNKKVWRDV
ncbi:MAG: putative metal-binding motif-containing protein [Candidatus Diapherotrites archaeon]